MALDEEREINRAWHAWCQDSAEGSSLFPHSYTICNLPIPLPIEWSGPPRIWSYPVLNIDESSAQIRWWRCCVPKHLLMGHISAPWCSTEHIIPLSLLSRPHTQDRAFSHLFASSDHCSPSLNWHPRLSETLYVQHDSAAHGRLIVTTSSNAGHSLSLKMTDSLKKPRSKAISHKK